MAKKQVYIIEGSGYSIYAGNDLSSAYSSFFKKAIYSSYFILVDEHTETHCLPLFLKRSKIKAAIIKIKSGEKNKTLSTCEKVWETLTHSNADRNALLINLGGGVIGDLGGFAASCYKRGIDFVQVPTTLLSMVDSSVGGKLGIDFKGFKNQIGVFAQPKAVFADLSFLNTLPEREIKSGYAEIIKHSLIADAKMFKQISQSEEFVIDEKLVAENISIKNKIVKKDFKEQNIRKALNFGHTIGHGVESLSLQKDKKPLLHGEAVIIGMMMESYISYLHHLISKNIFIYIYNYLMNVSANRNILKEEKEPIFALMLNDKKNQHGAINFTLLSAVGKFKTDQTAGKEEIFKAIDFYNKTIEMNRTGNSLSEIT